MRVTADAAYDTVAVYETARARGATVVIPPAKTATVSGHGLRSPARDRTITLVKTLDRRRWKKAALLHEDPQRVGRFGPHFSGPSAGATLQGWQSKVHPKPPSHSRTPWERTTPPDPSGSLMTSARPVRSGSC